MHAMSPHLAMMVVIGAVQFLSTYLMCISAIFLREMAILTPKRVVSGASYNETNQPLDDQFCSSFVSNN